LLLSQYTPQNTLVALPSQALWY